MIDAPASPSRTRRCRLRRRADRVLRPARPAALAHSRRAGRHLRHPDRAHRRAVPACASRTLGLERGRRLSRDGGAAAAHQGADAAAARRRRDAWEDPRAELVRRLLEYQQMREVVDVLERRGEERRNQFARAYLPQAARAAAGAARALAGRAARRRRSRPARRASSRRCTTSFRARSTSTGAITTIRAVLAIRASAHVDGRSCATSAEPWQVLSTLLGLLELAKLRRAARRAAETLCLRGDHS